MVEPVEEGRLTIAIDGPAGAGKSTLAQRLAEALGLPYINTGQMYRAVAAEALGRGVSPDDAHALVELARGLEFALSESDVPELRIDGRSPDHRLTSPDVEAVVSRVARHPPVREVLRSEQRRLADRGAVVEGRDIGTVVLPEADLKIFLSAAPDARADRRERERRGDPSAGEAIAARDARDARTNPFVPAPDAEVLDTTALGPDEVFREAMRLVAARMSGPRGADGDHTESGIEPSHEIEAHPEPADVPTLRRRVARVAIVGRPNVGKSTLLNRLVGRRDAISDELPGVTRDRLERTVTWGDRTVALIDTGGFTDHARGLDAAVMRQAARAADAADLILLVVDATTGVLESDEQLGRRLREAARPVLVVANKVDSEAQEALAAEFHSLGLGEPVPVSALHGRGAGELLDRVLDLLPEGSQPLLEGEVPRFALVGRPNVGKSSIFNRLLREERAVVHEEAGTTRDAVDAVVDVEGRTIRFVDTAGFRRLPKLRGVDYYGVIRSLRAIDQAHVAVLVIDASEGLTGEDKRVAARVVESGRGLVAVLNKWDLVPSEERATRFVDLQQELRLFPGTPVLRTSATTGLGVGRLVPALLEVHAAWSKRVATSDVNRVLKGAVASNPPPRGSGRALYGTQVSAGPPTFVVFGLAYPGAVYARYLENTLRREFEFRGVPVRLSFRARHTKRRSFDRRGADRRRPRT